MEDSMPADHRTKILAYLGALHPGEFVTAKKLIFDLGLRFSTAKNILTKLEQDWIVEKKITTDQGTQASFRIMPTATMKKVVNGIVLEKCYVPYIPPEWEATYGRHPHGL